MHGVKRRPVRDRWVLGHNLDELPVRQKGPNQPFRGKDWPHGIPSSIYQGIATIGAETSGCAHVDGATEKFGRVDVRVNNAGVFSPKPFLGVEEADLDRYYAINLKGTYFTSQAAIPAMQSQGGGARRRG